MGSWGCRLFLKPPVQLWLTTDLTFRSSGTTEPAWFLRSLACAPRPLISNVRFTLKQLLNYLLTPADPLWRYCLFALALALIPSIILFSVVYGILIIAGIDISAIKPPGRSATPDQLFGTILFAPIVETLLLALGIRILCRFISGAVGVAMISALIWGLLHGMLAPLWFFGTVWSFFVFSCAYLAWRQRSFWHGFSAAALPHSLINLSAMVAIALDKS